MRPAIESIGQVPFRAAPASGSIATFPPYGPPIGLDQARIIALGAAAEARRNGWRMAVAVTEPSGELVLLEKGDDTQYGSSSLAVTKAQAAARYRRGTKAFEDYVTQGALNVLSVSAAGVIALAGGLPIVVAGRIVGGVGVSGELSEQDSQVAEAGLDALAASLRKARG